MCVCGYVHVSTVALRGQEKDAISLELELHVIVRWLTMGTGNKTGFSLVLYSFLTSEFHIDIEVHFVFT